MRNFPNRCFFLLLIVVASWVTASTVWATDQGTARTQFIQLERTLNGRLGVFALDTNSGAQLGYRANERFPVCSTFKAFLAAAILDRSTRNPGMLQQRIRYTQNELVQHSPVTEKHIADGMTVAELLDAVLKYSDNTGANLLMRLLGGPTAVSSFVRSIGNHEFRLDNWEPHMNTTPNDPRDTSTPEAIGRSLQRIALGDVLKAPQREQLNKGLLSNSVAAALIRAGVPADWKVGDRSGGGSYGTRNDIAILWPPKNRPPIVLAIYTTQHTKEAAAREDVIAAATRIVVDWAQSSLN